MKKILTIASYLIGFGALSLQADLLIYEGFNYSGVRSDGDSMDNVTSNATGLTGSYNLLHSTGASITFKTTGLSFGSNFLSTSDGGIYLDGGTTYSVLEMSLNTPYDSPTTYQGTIYSSYLGKVTSMAGDEGLFTSRVANESGASYTRRFNSELDGRSDSGPAVGYGEDTTAASSGALTLDETYLVLARFTHVGETDAELGGETRTADQFVFTLSAYENWLAAGGVEGDLGTYASFTASDTNTIYEKHFHNGYQVEIGIAPLGGSGNETAYFDELRYGTTLADVVSVVPEPSSFLLMAGGMLLVGFGAFKRRHS